MRRSSKCKICRFRAEPQKIWQCAYSDIMYPLTRKAQDPAECTCFQEGARIQIGSKEAFSLMQTERTKRKRGGRKTKHDWGLAMELYKNGKNDGQICRALGCNPSVVREWRLREGLKANTVVGGRRKTE